MSLINNDSLFPWLLGGAVFAAELVTCTIVAAAYAARRSLARRRRRS